LFRYSLKDPAAKIGPLKMLKKEIQQQLEIIEQNGKAYFAKVEAYEDFHDFNSLDSADRARSSELRKQIANVVSELSNLAEHLPLFGALDQLALRDGIRCADAALRLRKYRRSPPYVEHEEDTVSVSIPGDQWEELTSISSAREEFMEGLDTIRRILILVPNEGESKTPLPTEKPTKTTSAKVEEKDFNLTKYGGKELCIVVSYFKAGKHDLKELAKILTHKAGIQYKPYLSALYWHEKNYTSWKNHVHRLRKKAREQGWWDAIPEDYHRSYL